MLSRKLLFGVIWAFPALFLVACQKKPADTQQAQTPAITVAADDEDNCPAQESWLAQAKEPDGTAIADDKPDCVFYQAAVRRFLWATQPQGDKPSFVNFPTVEKFFGGASAPLFPKAGAVFESATFRVAKQPNRIDAPGSADLVGSGIRQAGDVQGIVADASGNAVFYSIHVSQSFADFITRNKLTTADALRNAPDKLPFDGGVQEFKAAWQIVDDKSPPAGFLLVRHAQVPRLKKVGTDLIVDTAHPRDVTLALIAFHVAFALDNHAEMIWATFEHAPNGVSDVAPSAVENFPKAPTVSPVSASLSSGVASARKSSTPASAAIAAAVSGLSPVIITVGIPIRRSSAKRSRISAASLERAAPHR